jgi:DNA-binding XRE family transcriptional regulator
MDLREFMFRKELTAVAMAELVGCNPQSFVSLKKRKTSPSLLNAMKIIELSEGEVKIDDLLSKKDLENYTEWKGGKKKPEKAEWLPDESSRNSTPNRELTEYEKMILEVTTA